MENYRSFHITNQLPSILSVLSFECSKCSCRVLPSLGKRYIQFSSDRVDINKYAKIITTR